MGLLGDRPIGFVAREAARPANWAALARMPWRYPRFAESAWRYLTGRGEYPYRCQVRTPEGTAAATLFSPDDMVTMNEVFCREDYRAGPGREVVVDIGSNIGISALYFLTRAPSTRCLLYEPVPRNVERLRLNLAGFEGRYEVEQVAVADIAGSFPFATEPAGRYGGLDRREGERITVRVRHVNDVLEQALACEGSIDVLKLDTEGAEERTLRAIRADLLGSIGTIYLETDRPDAIELPGFEHSFRCDTLRLTRSSPQRD
jgi:FkbM family methyltransferase